jgi:hypothetical protein
VFFHDLGKVLFYFMQEVDVRKLSALSQIELKKVPV